MKKPNAPLDFLSAYDRPVANLVLGLRDLFFEEAPEAIEKVFASHPSAVWFGFCATTQEPKMTEMFRYIAASKHVNLGFFAPRPQPRVGRRGKEDAEREVPE